VVNAAITVGTGLVTGEKITFRKAASSFAGGAMSGGVAAATGNFVLGAAAGGAAESVVNDVGRTSLKNTIRNAVTKGVKNFQEINGRRVK